MQSARNPDRKGNPDMLRVYTASKLKHAAMWKALCAATPHMQCHARWLKHSTLGTPDTAEHASEFWLQDEQDVRDADAVLVYAEGEDHLRGALIEDGIAIACDVPVIVVGNHADYGTWQHHPGVTKVADLASALLHLKTITPRYRRAS
jgi:nucleoside 2-deoxyribosyltransferase